MEIALSAHAKKPVEYEPGKPQFDVLVAANLENTVTQFEVYTDRVAVEEYWKGPCVKLALDRFGEKVETESVSFFRSDSDTSHLFGPSGAWDNY